METVGCGALRVDGHARSPPLSIAHRQQCTSTAKGVLSVTAAVCQSRVAELCQCHAQRPWGTFTPQSCGPVLRATTWSIDRFRAVHAPEPWPTAAVDLALWLMARGAGSLQCNVACGDFGLSCPTKCGLKEKRCWSGAKRGAGSDGGRSINTWTQDALKRASPPPPHPCILGTVLHWRLFHQGRLPGGFRCSDR